MKYRQQMAEKTERKIISTVVDHCSTLLLLIPILILEGWRIARMTSIEISIGNCPTG
jgi:hypothetical protein